MTFQVCFFLCMELNSMGLIGNANAIPCKKYLSL